MQTFSMILQFVGILGGGVGIYGIFTDNMTLMIAGLSTAFVFCFCKFGSVMEHVASRLGMGVTFSLIGMLLTHFIGGVPWGMSLFYAAIFVYTIQAVSWTVMRFKKLI